MIADPNNLRAMTKTVALTNRQLTLIRVALITRLNGLKDVAGEDAAVQAAYDETRALLMGPFSLESLHK